MMMYVADPTYSCKEPNDFKLTAQANAKRIRRGDNEDWEGVTYLMTHYSC